MRLIIDVSGENKNIHILPVEILAGTTFQKSKVVKIL